VPTTAGRLALFDLDNTLVERNLAFRAWASEFVADCGLGPEAVEVLVAADREGHAPRREVFEPFAEAFGIDKTADEIESIYRIEYPRHFTTDDEVVKLLGELHSSGWKVVIVTNGPASQATKIERAGLSAVVDGWCISDVVGSAKPDRAIFEAAARLVDLPLAGWMVGDTAEFDVVGGRAAGLSPIWLSRGRPEPTDPALLADVIVDSLSEAVAVLIGR